MDRRARAIILTFAENMFQSEFTVNNHIQWRCSPAREVAFVCKKSGTIIYDTGSPCMMCGIVYLECGDCQYDRQFTDFNMRCELCPKESEMYTVCISCMDKHKGEISLEYNCELCSVYICPQHMLLSRCEKCLEPMKICLEGHTNTADAFDFIEGLRICRLCRYHNSYPLD
jgi:hypothetical protein